VFSAANPMRIGILGAGRIAPIAILDPARARGGDVVVSAVADHDATLAAAFARDHAIGAVAADNAALIARDDVDLVYNALPVAAHAHWSIRALEAGKPVLCEKALALDAGQARTMIAVAERAGLPLIEAFHYRFHGVMNRAAEIVRSGELGPLIAAAATFDLTIPYATDEIRWRADQGGGALLDLGAYCAHALRTLVGGEPEVVSATMRTEHGVDAATTAQLRFPGDLPARLRCSMVAERPVIELILRGERGRLHIGNFVLPQAGCRFTVRIDGALRDERVDGPSTYEAQLDHVIAVIDGRAAALTGGRDAIANLVLMDAIRAAAI
jgi:predicted dehydrogenase